MMIGLIAFVAVLLSGQTSAIIYKNVPCGNSDGSYTTCPYAAKGAFYLLDVSVAKQYPNSACERGSTFGIVSNNIWVKGGCRAIFNVRGCKRISVVTCYSQDNDYVPCNVPGDNSVNYISLKKEYSYSACTRYQTYGATMDKIWVSGNCRGSFFVCN